MEEVQSPKNEQSLGTAARDDAWWKLKSTQIGIFATIISTVSVFVAIAVAWGTLSSQGALASENELNGSLLEMRVSTETIKTTDHQEYVAVHVDLANKGKHALHPYAHTDDKGRKEFGYDGEGLTLSVTEHKLPEGEVPVSSLNAGEQRVISRYNVLAKKYSYWNGGYVIKPGQTYRETDVLVLNKGALYEVVARFYGIRKDRVWTNTDSKFVYLK
jgi:hypothetical protein